MSFDPSKRRLSLHVSGFWDVAAAHAQRANIRDALDDAGNSGSFTLLEDLTELQVQSKDVFGENLRLVAQLRGRPVVRHAMVTNSALLRTQIRRLFGGDLPLRFFDDVDGAEAWLDEAIVIPCRVC
jgi:hypothetical protein